MASYAAYKTTDELNRVIQTSDKEAAYWVWVKSFKLLAKRQNLNLIKPLLKFVTKFTMFADKKTDAHCTVLTYHKNNRTTLIVAFRGTEKFRNQSL